MVKRCKKCKRELKNDSGFCYNCGEKILIDEKEEAPKWFYLVYLILSVLSLIFSVFFLDIGLFSSAPLFLKLFPLLMYVFSFFAIIVLLARKYEHYSLILPIYSMVIFIVGIIIMYTTQFLAFNAIDSIINSVNRFAIINFLLIFAISLYFILRKK